MADLTQTIAQTVEARADRIVQTLCDLVTFPSIVKINPRRPARPSATARNISETLQELGFTDLGTLTVRRSTRNTGSARSQYRPHLRGPPQSRRHPSGAGGGRSMMLTGHIDGFHPARSNIGGPCRSTRRRGRFVGRGAVDMKGGVACM